MGEIFLDKISSHLCTGDVCVPGVKDCDDDDDDDDDEDDDNTWSSPTSGRPLTSS